MKIGKVIDLVVDFKCFDDFRILALREFWN